MFGTAVDLRDRSSALASWIIEGSGTICPEPHQFPEYEIEFAPDTRPKNSLEKLYSEGGCHWPARWIVRKKAA